MNIVINTKSGIAIYEQIASSIKEQIVKGELKPNEPLPSIRALAADLGISVITTKKAYENLETEHLIYSVQGKGFYVDSPDLAYLKEKHTQGIESALDEWVQKAKETKMTLEEALSLLQILWES
ncbi:MAG: GntR family transcriptional regulator [Clostridia bacterium]|nr:GntR family transcriptional regulator [Clostridia bacterium]